MNAHTIPGDGRDGDVSFVGGGGGVHRIVRKTKNGWTWVDVDLGRYLDKITEELLRIGITKHYRRRLIESSQRR